MSIDHFPSATSPEGESFHLTDEEREIIEERRRAAELQEERSRTVDLSEDEPGRLKTWHKVTALAAAALAGGVIGTKALMGGGDHDKAAEKRPAAAAPVTPGATHEATPAAAPEEGGFEALPPLVIDGKTYDGPTREAKIDAASKAFEIPADASPEEATRLLVDRLNTVLNWASRLPSDPTLNKKYDNFKLTESENSGDPNYKGYGGIAELREEALFPAAKEALIGDWSGGDADGMKDPAEWFSDVEKLSQTVGSHAGTARQHNLPPYTLEYKITPPDSSTSGIEVAGSIDNKTDISVFLTGKEHGLEGLQQLQTADGSSFESLKESGVLHFVLQKENDGTQKVVSAFYEKVA